MKVNLLNVGEENHAATEICIRGQLTLASDKFPNIKSVLFQTPPNKALKLKPGDLIPLSKSAVAIPYDSSFTVEAALFDYHLNSVVEGKAEFPFVL